MAFKRALWHSGLTYRHTCERCKTVVEYDDYKLDYRPWFPDGYVYCPKCKGPLRHSERLAINPDGTPYYVDVEKKPVGPETTESTNGRIAYCSECGTKYEVGSNFCPGCGKKLK